MKGKNVRNVLKSKTLNVKAFSMMVALFFMAASTFAQVQPDKLRIIPTVEGDETTMLNFGEHVTDSAKSNSGRVLMFNKNETNQIDEARTGAWAEYQIISPAGGKFKVTALYGSKMNDVLLNIGVYKTELETWPVGGAGDTVAIENNGNWNGRSEANFIIEVEAGVAYTLRINYLSKSGADQWTVNLHDGLTFTEVTGSTDATLKDLKINGETVDGFNPKKYLYNVPLPPYQWVEAVEAIVNDETAILETPEIGDPTGAKTTLEFKVTSESGISAIYTVNLLIPTLIEEGSSLAMDQFYSTSGVAASATKVNSFNNNDYIEYYVYTAFDENVELTLNCANGYAAGTESYLNISTLGLNDTTWALNDIYTKNIPVTTDELGLSTWNTLYAKDYTFTFALKAEEPTLIRIYSITNQGNATDVFSMNFSLIFESIDATLGDLQVDGVTVEGFSPNKTKYDVVLPVGATTANVTATPNDANAQGVTGAGAVDIVGFKTADTLTVTAESGFSIDYIVNFVTPIELAFTTDSIDIVMADWMYKNGGVKATNTLLNYFLDEMYVEYYLYSATDVDMHMVMNISNGNLDSTYSKINVSTYSPGSEWVKDDANTVYIPRLESGMWTIDFATDVKYSVSLKANEPTIMRIYGMNDGTGCGDIHSLTMVKGATDFVGVEKVASNDITVVSGNNSLTVMSDASYVGGTMQLFDISGRLVASKLISSTTTNYSVERSGLYIVNVVSPTNTVHNIKCIVK